MTAPDANGLMPKSEPEKMLQHDCYNIRNAWMTLIIMNHIENCDNLSTSSESSEETEEALLEQDANDENETTCSDEEYCDNLSTNSQSSEEALSVQVAIENEPITINEARLCKICYVAEYETAFSPCGHVVACAECALSVEKCPICRNQFEKVMRIYFS